MDLKSPSSGDCVVVADARRHDVWAVTSLPRWQPRFTESRTPTGTEPSAPQKVRMEAGRIGGGRSSSRRGHATSGTSKFVMTRTVGMEWKERSKVR